MAKRVKKTPKQRAKVFAIVLAVIVAIIGIVAGAIAIMNYVSVTSSKEFVSSISAVEYEDQLKPQLDDGYYTFVTDEDIKVVQLTDVHIGAGWMSSKKDSMAINAVTAMLKQEKPDLVVVTGDIAYPVPFQAGTFNNKNGAIIFADLMEQLGVYWCLAFGNHDTEAYSYYTREDISELYGDHERYPHCLFQAGPEDVDGYGNYVVRVKNTIGQITNGLIMLDSHSYIDNDYLGILWKYDCVHANQVDWYEQEINAMTAHNFGETPKTEVFIHMPLQEMQDAYYDYRDNGFSDTKDTKYLFGKAGEKDLVIYPSSKNYGLFDRCASLGSTQGIFFGHDHLNNISMEYKGVQLTYGFAVDYLAYSGIAKFGAQRGCTILDIAADGTMKSHQENYYQDKYQGEKQKESVTMDDYYSE